MGLSDAIIRVGQLNCQDVNVTLPPYDSEVEYIESSGTHSHMEMTNENEKDRV